MLKKAKTVSGARLCMLLNFEFQKIMEENESV
jgi:hypothetical protein